MVGCSFSFIFCCCWVFSSRETERLSYGKPNKTQHTNHLTLETVDFVQFWLYMSFESMEMRNMYEMCFTKTILFHCIDLDCIFPYSLSFSLSLSMTMCHCTAQVNRVGSKVRYMRKLKASSPHFIKRNEYSCRQTICRMRLFCYQCVA